MLTLVEAETQLSHLPYRGSQWWRSAISLTKRKLTFLLDEIGDEIDHDDDDPEGGVNVDAIMRQNNL